MEATGKYRTRGFIGESNMRVIFGKFVYEKQLADFYWQFELPRLSS